MYFRMISKLFYAVGEYMKIINSESDFYHIKRLIY